MMEQTAEGVRRDKESLSVHGSLASNLLLARTRMVMLEITSRCNLRCTYCAKSHPGNGGEDMKFELDSILPDLELLTPHEIQLSGHGETTILAGWSDLASRLIDRGMPITLTSNFSRAFSEEEIAVLAEMQQITISCDTADPEIFKAIRRGSEITSVEENLRRLRARGDEIGRRPYLAINCVLTPRTAGGLNELVHWAVDQGTQCVSMVQHVDHGQRGSTPAAHAIESDDWVRLTEVLGDASQLAGSLGIDFNHMGSVPVPKEPEDEPAEAEHTAELKAKLTAKLTQERSGQPFDPLQEAPTRDCTDPWKKLYVNADGDVALCCWSPPVGNVRETSLESIRNGEAAFEMRAGLLSGNLTSACAACPVRSMTTAANLEDDVRLLDLPDEQPLSFKARRRIREYLDEQQNILQERSSLMEEQRKLSAQRQEILEHHHSFRSSPLRLIRAFARACLSPILGPPKSYWKG